MKMIERALTFTAVMICNNFYPYLFSGSTALLISSLYLRTSLNEVWFGLVATHFSPFALIRWSLYRRKGRENLWPFRTKINCFISLFLCFSKNHKHSCAWLSKRDCILKSHIRSLINALVRVGYEFWTCGSGQ